MTPKQREFCRFYAAGETTYGAAQKAGYTKKYATGKAHNLLKNPEIVAEIKRIRDRVNKMAERNATDVVNEYSKIAFADRVDFLKEDPHRPGEFIYKAPNELTEDQRSIVEKVTIKTCDIHVMNPETGEVQSLVRQEYNYVLADKANALQQMGRHFGIFDDKIKLNINRQNPFANASPEQLEQLRSSFIKTMNKPALIEGEAVNVKE